MKLIFTFLLLLADVVSGVFIHRVDARNVRNARKNVRNKCNERKNSTQQT